MRCPECEQRNSVAANKCKFCGAKFKRKSMPLGKKITLLVAGVILVGVVYFSLQLPKMVDPAEQLSAAAKRVAAGPKSVEDAKAIKEAFDSAVEKLLKRYGSENPTALANKLKALLPATAFEVLVVDLPKGLKLVEIDTILQASDFVVMKGTNDTKVFRLPGFEVFDDARSVSDQAGPVIVLLGHSGGQLPHRPMVRTYALLPDSIEDDSKNMVPAFTGEGTAKFVKDTADIAVELTAPSVAQSEKLSVNPSPGSDKVINLMLRWKDAKYQPEIKASADPLSYLLLLARNMKYPEYWPASAAYLGPSATKLLKDHSSPQIASVEVKKLAEKAGVQSFVMNAANKKFDLDLKPAGALWQLSGYKVSEVAKAGAENSTVLAIETKSATDSKTSPEPSSVSPNPTPSAATTSTETSTPISAKTVVSSSTVSSAVDTSKTKSGSPIQTNSKVLPTSLISSMPGPASAGKNVKTEDNSKNNAKGTGTSWLGDDDENAHGTKHVAILPAGIKKNLEIDKNADKKNHSQQKGATAKQDAGSTAGTISGGTSSVRMRSGPGLGKRTITEVPNGASIQILGQEKGWYRVKYGGKIGYVFSPLVATTVTKPADPAPVSKSPPATSKQPEKNKQAQKNATAKQSAAPSTPSASVDSSNSSVIRRPMNVRDDSRRKIGVVQPGDKVVVIGSMKNERYKVRLSDGRVGWVHKDALGSVSASKIAPDTTGGAEVETPPEFVP